MHPAFQLVHAAFQKGDLLHQADLAAVLPAGVDHHFDGRVGH